MISVKLNGIEYTNFISAKVYRSMENAIGSFSLQSSADKFNTFPLKAGDTVDILADGELVIRGYVDKISVSYDAESHTIAADGRGVLCDLIDSSLKNNKEFTSSVSLIGVAKSIISDLGIKARVINNAGSIAPFNEEEITSGTIGQNAFEFLESFARKRFILINSSPEGDLEFIRGNEKTAAPAKLQNIIGADGNNIKAATLSFDESKIFRTYKVKSQLNPVFLGIGVEADDISDQSGTSSDRRARATRFLEIVAEQSMDTDNTGSRAIWEANWRRAKSIVYSAIIQGHSANGEVWKINTLAEVSDNFCDLNTKMRIQSVEFTYDLASGSQTSITLVSPDAFTLQAERAHEDEIRKQEAQLFGL